MRRNTRKCDYMKTKLLAYSTALLLVFSIVFTGCKAEEKPESEVNSEQNVETIYIEGIGEVTGTVEILTDTRQDSIEVRQQRLLDAMYDFDSCNVLEITLVQCNGNAVKNEIMFVYEDEQGNEYTFSAEYYNNTMVGNGYRNAVIINDVLGETYTIYYYGELPTNGKLDNAALKMMFPSNHEFEWLNATDYYPQTVSFSEFLERYEQNTMSIISNQEHQQILGYDEAIFWLVQSEEFLEEIKPTGYNVKDSVIKKITVSEAEWYYIVGDMIFYPEPLQITGEAVLPEDPIYGIRYHIIIANLPEDSETYKLVRINSSGRLV